MLSVRFLILSVFCLTTSVGLADDKVRAMLGKAAPQWKDLAGADGKLHSSSEYDGARATVVVFLCNHCPCAKSYQNRFIDFVKNYKSKGVGYRPNLAKRPDDHVPTQHQVSIYCLRCHL